MLVRSTFFPPPMPPTNEINKSWADVVDPQRFNSSHSSVGMYARTAGAQTWPCLPPLPDASGGDSGGARSRRTRERSSPCHIALEAKVTRLARTVSEMLEKPGSRLDNSSMAAACVRLIATLASSVAASFHSPCAGEDGSTEIAKMGTNLDTHFGTCLKSSFCEIINCDCDSELVNCVNICNLCIHTHPPFALGMIPQDEASRAQAGHEQTLHSSSGTDALRRQRCNCGADNQTLIQNRIATVRVMCLHVACDVCVLHVLCYAALCSISLCGLVLFCFVLFCFVLFCLSCRLWS